MKNIRVFSAGVAGKLARITAQRYEAEIKGATCEIVSGGSTDGVRRLLAGEKFDVMILADNSNIDQMLMPEYADGYYIWGGNEMVVIGKGINSENWKEKLLDPESQIVHTGPYGDPSGYRAVMAMKLADKVEPGLSEKLLNHPKYLGLDKEKGPASFKMGELKDNQYLMIYKSAAYARQTDFSPLPPVMNLGDPKFEETYQSVEFAVSDNETVRGTTILHAITIPLNAENKEGAKIYAEMFISNRFRNYGFTEVERKVGNWELKEPDKWSHGSKYYDIMCLMEGRGTDLQLDAVPLDPDDVVLDCGCGSGRVAVQLAKRVKKVICLDSSESMLEACKKNCANAGLTNVEFVLADWQTAELGVTIPEVDVIIQSRGGGGDTSFERVKKFARKYAVIMMFSAGAIRLPVARSMIFEDCYPEDIQAKYPELRPMTTRKAAPRPTLIDKAGRSTMPLDDTIPIHKAVLNKWLDKMGIEYQTTEVSYGWERLFKTKQEAYDWFIELSSHPEFVDMDKFRANVDSFLTEREDGWFFFIPTANDVTWFKTR